MTSTGNLNEQFDLEVRAAGRPKAVWECSGDIVNRHSGKSLARVYGNGRTSAAAELEVLREAERWLLRGMTVR